MIIDLYLEGLLLIFLNKLEKIVNLLFFNSRISNNNKLNKILLKNNSKCINNNLIDFFVYILFYSFVTIFIVGIILNLILNYLIFISYCFIQSYHNFVRFPYTKSMEK